MVEVLKKAPDFDLMGDDGKSVQLSKLKGHPVVLYFYPKDDTSGCTREALDFTDLAPQFKKAKVHVFGISPDPIESHTKFRCKHNLGVRLLSDENKKVASAYGVWVEKSMYGKKYMGVERSTILINSSGKIEKIWRKVSVQGHAQEVLDAVKTLSL